MLLIKVFLCSLVLSIIIIILTFCYTVNFEVKSKKEKIYKAKDFEHLWIQDENKHKGLKYKDHSGCYVFFINNHKCIFKHNYKDVYVGQSINVYQRVHNHLNGKGNGDVYADFKYGKYITIKIVKCKKQSLNKLETQLIKKYNATKSYNKTKGGSKLS